MPIHRANRAGLRLLILAGVLASSSLAQAAGPTRVAFKVFGDDKYVVDGLSACLTATFKAKVGYEVVDKLPAAELLLYVNRDANDRVNPKGVSIAVAHVSNAAAIFVAKTLLIDPATKTSDPAVRSAATAMVNQEGNLDHLSVVHIDKPGPEENGEVCQSVAATFFEKTPAMAGK